jgi:hypothetical protein
MRDLPAPGRPQHHEELAGCDIDVDSLKGIEVAIGS